MFPPKIFNRVSFQVNVWSQGCVTIDFTLPTKDHIANYFLLMKSNETQITMIDYETKLITGFNVPSAPLLR